MLFRNRNVYFIAKASPCGAAEYNSQKKNVVILVMNPFY